MVLYSVIWFNGASFWELYRVTNILVNNKFDLNYYVLLESLRKTLCFLHAVMLCSTSLLNWEELKNKKKHVFSGMRGWGRSPCGVKCVSFSHWELLPVMFSLQPLERLILTFMFILVYTSLETFHHVSAVRGVVKACPHYFIYSNHKTSP